MLLFKASLDQQHLMGVAEEGLLCLMRKSYLCQSPHYGSFPRFYFTCHGLIGKVTTNNLSPGVFVHVCMCVPEQ